MKDPLEWLFSGWQNLGDKAKLSWLIIACLVLAACFFIPFTRQIILFILPLGSGVDDAIVMLAILCAVIFFIARYAMSKKKNRRL